jgi:cytochrome c553
MPGRAAALVVPGSPLRPQDVGTPGPERKIVNGKLESFRPRRTDTKAYGDKLRAERARWNSPAFVAKQLRVALENPTRVFDSYLATRAEAVAEFRKAHPQAVQVLGAAAIVAATPASSACRWCHGAAFSRVHRIPPPDSSSIAVRSLLGPPCAHQPHLRAQADAVLKRVEPYRRAVRARARAATFNSLLASGQIVRKDAKGRPVRLRANPACASCHGPDCPGCVVATGYSIPLSTSSTQRRFRLSRVETGKLR